MAKLCETCGDTGVVECIKTCSCCRIRAHLYCTRTDDKDLLCEECEKSYLQKDLLQVCFSEKKGEKGKVKYITAQEAIKLSSGSKKSESPSRTNLHLSPRSTETLASPYTRTPIKPKAIDPNLSTEKIKANPTKRPPSYLDLSDFGNTQTTLKFRQLKGSSAVLSPVKDNALTGQPLKARKAVEEIETTDAMLEKTRESNGVVDAVKSHALMRQPMTTLKTAEEFDSTDAKSEEAVIKESDAPLYSLSINCPHLIVSGGNACTDMEARKLLRDPAQHAFWKGGFKLRNNSLKHGGLNDGFQAHPPTSVRLRIYEFVKKMPEVLEFELLPRDKIWMDIFQGECPDKDEIGLYFFPSNSERSSDYVVLLESIWVQDLVMKSYINGVELLVFTSRCLHVESQKWNGNYFFWGLFRRVKKVARCKDKDQLQLVVCPQNGAHDTCANGNREGSEAIDMDIDMVGGENVGRVDTVAPKDSFRRENLGTTFPQPRFSTVKSEMCIDIPPGFEGTALKMKLC